jgi:ankyrin repeat protein
MKKAFFYITLSCVLFGFFLMFTMGCKTAPAAEEDPLDKIWAMLRTGDSQVMGFFKGEFDVNVRDSEGKSPLHYAVEIKDAPLTSFFIACGADVNAVDFQNRSPLWIAVNNDDSVISPILVAAGANIHQQTGSATPASFALTHSNAIFKTLLTPKSVELADGTGKTVLHMASIAGNIYAVNDVLTVNTTGTALINKKDNQDKNALDYAYEKTNSRDHFQIAEQLILAGGQSDDAINYYFAPAVRSGNYNIRRNEGLAPIHYAVMENYMGLITFLFEKDININIKSTSGATPLHEAARTGNIVIVRMLLERGADVNATDAKGNTALHTGVPSNVHREIITYLLENGADPNIRDEHGDTPLHVAIILNRQLDVIQTLLGGGSDVHIRNIDGQTPLYLAIQNERDQIIPVLLTYGSEVFAADNSGITPFDIAVKKNGRLFDMMVTPETVNQRDSEGNSLLHAAVKNRASSRQIGLILDNRALVDARNRDGDTSLHIAVRTDQRQSGEFLLSRGANIYAINAAGQSPLYIALSPDTGIREWMINSTTINSRDGLGNNMLHYASQWNFDAAIPVILRYGVSIEDQNATGETPLFMAVKSNSPSTIGVLINNRANLNARDGQGNSVLHAAVRWNAVNSASSLISLGIDINSHSLNGNTPLHDAVTLGMADIETLLINQGADLEARNLDGNTPFMEAVKAGYAQSMDRLAAKGADTSTRNSRGDTPLHIAVSLERTDVVNLLLRSGASIHARNTRGRTPFQISLSLSTRMTAALLTRDRINIADDMGNSALHIALQEKVGSEYITTILGQGARINAVDSNGKTALRLAIDLEQWQSAKLLADAGADPYIAAVDSKTAAEIAFEKGETCIRAVFSGRAISAKDSSENTILHFAARYGNPASINLLMELGANRTLRNISAESPYDIARRWNKTDNADILR